MSDLIAQGSKVVLQESKIRVVINGCESYQPESIYDLKIKLK